MFKATKNQINNFMGDVLPDGISEKQLSNLNNGGIMFIDFSKKIQQNYVFNISKDNCDIEVPTNKKEISIMDLFFRVCNTNSEGIPNIMFSLEPPEVQILKLRNIEVFTSFVNIVEGDHFNLDILGESIEPIFRTIDAGMVHPEIDQVKQFVSAKNSSFDGAKEDDPLLRFDLTIPKSMTVKDINDYLIPIFFYLYLFNSIILDITTEEA